MTSPVSPSPSCNNAGVVLRSHCRPPITLADGIPANALPEPITTPGILEFQNAQ